ncbi:SDR family oxidoreductase [Mycobacterium sp. CBMA293]|uniref:SDR family NAD(P)-dependent oxidoreductase n=1 Tax=unclassified Mycolicibacterium TaxID=2636767 RepID=UPI0012DC8777|nr:MULTISPECIES: SDR family NAD(P)-dependent oxidoreductase [unclassified Mycolicibacterium]MUL49898.1 SDR family oxidoreductase [Mycolicibacterium sp. CBMA 360]MUL62717.1 SDR family oxidoreductase [Mycolicibacterium sp. CBMA 335]MUL70735.1 SDR family oxidoreductase [Mycolicibacterium sp. CBMA 311]MUL97241.1 SDR family oxidoreductase [Mycolicibacterium sp. CBMA 230]MUM07989.1 oxidoreductase [Mycolicibacterium sp. CBMA 213]
MPDNDWLALENAAVLVAGAGGIGTASALGYARQGARVLLVDNNSARLEAAAGEITAEVPDAKVHQLQADLTEPGCGVEVVRAAIERLGGLDVFLHAVGINDRRPILDFTFEEWDRLMRINLNSAFELAQACGRHMVDQQRGRIIMLSSVSGLLAHAKHGPYAAAKGGMNQLMRVMAREWASRGVTVNAIAPGYIETNLTAAYLAQPGVREGLVELVPAGRLGTPDEVVGPILFLSSEHASFITGHIVYVDGGRTLV